jgi:hypothetical protein
MKFGLSVDESSWRSARLKLRNFATLIPSNARKTMRRAAERIVKKAKLYVPEDTSALMDSIRLEVSYGARGRLQIDVVMGGTTHVTVNGNVIFVDQYALLVHEHYEDFVVNPSPKTLAKMAANPGKVGSGFLLRAAKEEEDVLRKDMIIGIQSVIDAGDF